MGLSQSDSTDHELLGKRPGRKEAWMALACGTSDGIALALSGPPGILIWHGMKGLHVSIWKLLVYKSATAETPKNMTTYHTRQRDRLAKIAPRADMVLVPTKNVEF